jgi:hypothetical protein
VWWRRQSASFVRNRGESDNFMDVPQLPFDMKPAVDALHQGDYNSRCKNIRGGNMNCVTETVTKMIESLPEHLQKKLLDEITPIISEALDEAKWEDQFQRGNSKLVELSEGVREHISKGSVEPMDFSKL